MYKKCKPDNLSYFTFLDIRLDMRKTYRNITYQKYGIIG